MTYKTCVYSIKNRFSARRILGKQVAFSFTQHRQLAKVTSKAFFHYSFSTLHNLLIPVLLQEREFFSKFANVIS